MSSTDPGSSLTGGEQVDTIRIVIPLDLHEIFDSLTSEVLRGCTAAYSDRLVSFVLFGSVARRTCGPESDVDFLVVAEELPRGRLKRVGEFTRVVEEPLRPVFDLVRDRGVNTRLSPLFKTPEEVRLGSPLFLDMTEDARILFDRGGFFAARMEDLRRRLRALGSRRVREGDRWYWVLKPDLRPGEVFEI